MLTYVPKAIKGTTAGSYPHWVCEVLGAKARDEMVALDLNEVERKQDKADWEAALNDAATLWKNHDSAAYAGTLYSNVMMLIKNGEPIAAKKLAEKEQEFARQNFYSSKDKLASNSEVNQGISNSKEVALQAIHQSLFEAYMATKETEKAKKELDTLLYLDKDPNTIQHFVNLLRAARLAPLKERKTILNEASNLQIPDSKKKIEITQMSKNSDKLELLPEAELVSNLGLINPIYPKNIQHAICNYNLALMYKELGDKRSATLAIKNMQKDADWMRVPGCDGKIAYELTSDEENP